MSNILCYDVVMADPNNPIFLTCDCGQAFRKYQDGEQRKRYCSPECRKKYRTMSEIDFAIIQQRRVVSPLGPSPTTA